MSRWRRRGFSLVELLVVIAILGAVAGVTVPAVQAARESARRAQCASNLKQYGIATQNYHAAHRRLPVGNVPEQYWTFQSFLLPYLEAQAVYDLIDYGSPRTCFEVNAAAPPGRDPGSVVLPVNLCPSDPLSGQVNSNFASSWGFHVPTEYLGVSGTSPTSEDGIYYSGSRTRFGDVTDGLSKTIIMGERGIPENLLFGWSVCAAGVSPPGSGNEDNLLSTENRLRRPLASGAHNDHFWSHHPAGAQFLMADGAVRLLPYDSSHQALRELSTRAGGEVWGL